MKKQACFKKGLLKTAAFIAISLVTPHFAFAHCDTLDGPVIDDARKAIDAKDVTPVLKWVKSDDEETIRAAFQQLLSEKGSEESHVKFFEKLVQIHRAAEGEPFTGLKPAGAVEPAIAEADKALERGSADALVKLINEDIEAGIQKRYQHALETYKHKDESVAQGREFVNAYVTFTHYIERIHQDATAQHPHGSGGEKNNHGVDHKKHVAPSQHDHSKH